MTQMPSVHGVGVAEAAQTLNTITPHAVNGVGGTIGLIAGALTTISGILYFVWRRFQRDSRDTNTGNMQQELFAQLQAAADQHLKSVREIQGLLDAERAYSAMLAQRNSDQLRAWAEERRLWEEDRRQLVSQLSDAATKISTLNTELIRMSDQIHVFNIEIARLKAAAN